MKPIRKRWWLALPAVALVGLGVLLSSAGHWALAQTNSVAFCVSCHEMKDNNYADYRHTVHARNRSGVTAGCADCHVPHEFPDVLVRKAGAARDVLHHLLGTIDTPEKFARHRLELAQRVWLRMEQTDSRECRNCHDAAAMNSELQGRTAQKQHRRMRDEHKTCIDCHYGIAHREPGGGAEPGDVLRPGGVVPPSVPPDSRQGLTGLDPGIPGPVGPAPA